MRTFPARPPTWIDRWAASGGHRRRLRRRDTWFAARWAYRNGFRLLVDADGYCTLTTAPQQALQIRL